VSNSGLSHSHTKRGRPLVDLISLYRWVRLESVADTDAGDEAEIVADKGGACRRGPVVVPDAGDADAEAGTQVHGEFEREFEAVAQADLAGDGDGRGGPTVTEAHADLLDGSVHRDSVITVTMSNGEIKLS